MQTQTTDSQSPKEVIFDEQGNTVDIVDAEIPDDSAPEEAAAPKYRIGDKEFATQDEALTYAQSQVSALETETQVSDAYRQGMRDAMSQTPSQQQSVTAPAPTEPALNTEELYTNPQEFLQKYATKIKTEALSEIKQHESLRAQSDQIWREFTDRHPSLAEFRSEVENFVQGDQANVRAIIQTKGRPASYDFIATKLRARFESYAGALKPKRELANTTAGASPTTRASGVTPKPDTKKPLSFSEQIRSIRKRR